MKRVIKASGYSRKHPELVRLREKIRAGEDDLRYLENCETIDDVINHRYELVDAKYLTRKLSHKSGADFTAALNEAIDTWSDYLDDVMGKYASFASKVKLFNEYISKLTPHFDVELEGDYAKIFVDEDLYEDEDGLGQFVDEINSILDSEYYATGRGGSWTAYNLLTPEGVELQVGNIDPVQNIDNCWGIKVVGI